MKLNIKSTFFAQYYMQKLMRSTGWADDFPNDFVNPSITAKNFYLLLRSINDLTDEELIQIARFAHQLPSADFKIQKGNGVTHVEHIDRIGIKHHVSIMHKYPTVCANMFFPKYGETEAHNSTVNIGQISLSSALAIPYIAIVDYLRSKGFALPFTHLNDQNQPETYSVEKLVEMGWVMIKPNN